MDCCIELHSMSKGFNMTGWRLGWVCGNALAVNAFASVKDNADSGQFIAIQKAAVKALDAQAEITPAISAKYSRRLGALAEILRDVGFDAVKPKGSFFMYVAIPKALEDGSVTFKTGEDFSQWLIRQKLISTVPWDDAGHYVRFSATFVARDLADETRVLDEVKRRLSDVKLVF
jgi:LL-diaminopimelate aminotransferase